MSNKPPVIDVESTVTGTDLNDLKDPVKIKAAIENATEPPSETSEEAIARLAQLHPVEYDRRREDEADKLEIRVATLDSLVLKKRDEFAAAKAGGDGITTAVEPWPDSVNGDEVLNQVVANFNRYTVLPDGAADAMALWAAHTHCINAFMHSPRLNIKSPEKGCGKTTARDVVALHVPRPLPTENMSTAVLFRIIEKSQPTVLADEYDTWLRDNEELRGMLNAGHKRGGQALRCEGDSHEVRAFKVYAPVVLCGIGTLPGTLHDRSIVVSLVRARPGEVQQRLDSRRTAAEQETCRKLARWVKDNYSAIEAREPALPTGAYNRVADNWRPLFAIAEVVGGAWPARASAAYTKLTSHDDTNTQGIRITLLADIRDILTSGLLTRISSADLCKRLVELEEQPWPEYGKGKPISQNQLSRLLRPFDIQPRNIKVDGKSPKGYHAEDFADAFSRYLPVPGDSNRYPATEAVNTGENGTLHPLPGLNGSGLEKPKSPNVYAGGSGVAVQNPVEHVEEAV